MAAGAPEGPLPSVLELGDQRRFGRFVMSKLGNTVG